MGQTEGHTGLRPSTFEWTLCAAHPAPRPRRRCRYGAADVRGQAVSRSGPGCAARRLRRAVRPRAADAGGASRVLCATGGATHGRAPGAPRRRDQTGGGACPQRRTPIAAERLDVETKKAEREQQAAHSARVMSGFVDAPLHAMLTARRYDAGLALQRVSPAYTPVLGACTCAESHGLSRHRAPVTSIGRPGMRLAERPNRRPAPRSPSPTREDSGEVRVGVLAGGRTRRVGRGRPDPAVRSSPAARTARRAIRYPCQGTPAREPSVALFS